MKKTTLITALAMFLVLSTSAFATTVLGTANVFGAISLTGASFDNSGTAPPEVAVASGSEIDILTTGVTTPLSCSSIFCANGDLTGGNGADGAYYSDLPGATQITSPGNGISGISFAGDSMFLVGVFINSSAPPTTGLGPTALNYGVNGGSGPASTTNNATDAPTFAPALDQVFYIGDGTEGYDGACPGSAGTPGSTSVVDGLTCVSGQVQGFFVPTGANELFLGFVDGASVMGTPGYYGDNAGNITVSVSSPVPEPGTMLLMGLGLAACAMLRKKLA